MNSVRYWSRSLNDISLFIIFYKLTERSDFHQSTIISHQPICGGIQLFRYMCQTQQQQFRYMFIHQRIVQHLPFTSILYQ